MSEISNATKIALKELYKMNIKKLVIYALQAPIAKRVKQIILIDAPLAMKISPIYLR